MASIELDGNQLVVECRGARFSTGVMIDKDKPSRFEADIRKAILAAVRHFNRIDRELGHEAGTIDVMAAVEELRRLTVPAQLTTTAQAAVPRRRQRVAGAVPRHAAARVELNENELVIVYGTERFSTGERIDPVRPETILPAIERARDAGIMYFSGMRNDEAIRQVGILDIFAAEARILQVIAASVDLRGNELIVICRGERHSTGVNIDPNHPERIETDVRRAVQNAAAFFAGYGGDDYVRGVQALDVPAIARDLRQRIAAPAQPAQEPEQQRRRATHR